MNRLHRLVKIILIINQLRWLILIKDLVILGVLIEVPSKLKPIVLPDAKNLSLIGEVEAVLET